MDRPSNSVNRVLFVLELPVSYRSGWLAHVRASTDLDLHALYLAGEQPDRPWEDRAEPSDWIHFAQTTNLGGTKTGFFPRLSLDLGAKIDEIDPDFVIIPGWAHPASWQAMRWCRRNERPYGVMFESWQSQGQTKIPPAVSTRVRQRVLEGAAVALPIGERAAVFARGLGIKNVRTVHGNTCDSSAIAELTEDIKRHVTPTALFVGRLMPHKGSQLLLESIERLQTSGIDIRIIGDGPDRAAFESAAAVHTGVQYLGPMSPADVIENMAKAHVILVPSLDEPWGVVVHEALSAGTPVVATNEVGSATDLITSNDVGRVTSTDSRELSEAAIEIIESSDSSTAAACRSAAGSVSYEAATAELVSALASVKHARHQALSTAGPVRTPRLVIDARTARTGGGATVLRVIEEQLVPTLSGIDVEIRRPPTSPSDVRNHPAAPLTFSGRQPEIVLSLSEAGNLGAGGNQRTIMMARNWNCWLPAETPRRRARAAMARRNLGRADDVVVATNAFADAIRPIADAGTNLVVQPFGVGSVFTPEGPHEAGSYFLCVGDWYPWKKFELAVEAFARIAVDLPDAELRIAGRPLHPDYLAATLALTADFGLGDRVHALGNVEAEPLASLYRGALATVATSELETFGHPYLEALACGSPLIGRSMPVTEELVGGHAVLVDGSIESFASAMRAFAASTSEDARAAAIDHVAQYSWDRYLMELRRLISDGVEPRRQSERLGA